MNKFVFKNIKISFKKLLFFSSNFLKISNYIFEIIIYLNFFNNKSSFILKKIFYYIINNFKNNKNYFNCSNLKIKSFIINKGKYFKRLNYRAKGKTDIFKKKFCNIFIILF